VRRLLALALLPLAACAGSRTEPPPGERFGTRLPDEATVETLDITQPGEEERFFTAPAVVDEVVLRVEPFTPGAGAQAETRVEALIKGAFPDACSALHGVAQERSLRLVDVTLEMRRPQGQLCATVVRPYRFYLLLDGTYAPGAYTLFVNGASYPFDVDPPPGE
jgi:hypothetical protein